MEAKIIDIEENSDGSLDVDMKLISFNDIKYSKKVKLTLYSNNDISSGDIIRFEGYLYRFESKSNFDFVSYYTSSGFSAHAEAYEIEILENGQPPISYKLKKFRNMICDRASELTNDATGSMLGALLLGERDRLDPQIRLDFSRIGISHILSLSGMHLAILVAALSFLLKLFKIGKRIRLIINCIFCLAFMALTGFPSSVLRAGLMLIISSLVYLLSGSRDSITSLSIAAMIIIVISPYAVFDIGLWLSVIATFGILVSGELTRENSEYNEGFKRWAVSLLLSLLFSLFAICATTAVTSIAFGTFPVLSIISTFFISLLVQAFIYVGLLLLLLGGFAPISSLAISISEFIASVSAKLSDISGICPSASSPIVIACSIAITVIFFIFVACNIKRRKTYVFLMGIAYVTTAMIAMLLSASSLNSSNIAISSNNGEAIVLRSDKKALLFSASPQRNSNGYNDLDLLSREGISELDTLYIAHITNYTPQEVGKVLSGIKTNKVILPIAKNEDENEIIFKTIDIIEGFRTDYAFHQDELATDFGYYRIFVSHRSDKANSFAVNFFTDDYSLSYLSDGILEYSHIAEELMYVSNYIILGDYGTAYSKEKTVYDCSEKLIAIISFNKYLKFDFDFYDGTPPKVINDRNNITINPKLKTVK